MMPNPVRFGFVGSGYIADIIARAFTQVDGAVITAVASRQRANAVALATRHRIPQVFDTWQAMVESDAVDAVYVATPTHIREEICLAAAAQGKHILADKPFLNYDSVQRITAACRAQGAAFMDATHFVHHPRTTQIKAEMTERIGPLRAMHSAFFFPTRQDSGNIRLDPAQEPMGAIGDMAWYSMRAIVEYLKPEGPPIRSESFIHLGDATGAALRGAGLMIFPGGQTSTWNIGFDVGNVIMNLDLMGERGYISLDDFVLDWENGFPTGDPQHTAHFIQRNGIVNAAGYERVATPSGKPQASRMIEAFAACAHDPAGAAVQANMQASEQTQLLVDTIWSAHERPAQ
jgi:predicted dehydrogenase